VLLPGLAEFNQVIIDRLSIYGWNFIQKPFVPQALIAKVNELLHSAQPTPCDQRLCNSAGVRN